MTILDKLFRRRAGTGEDADYTRGLDYNRLIAEEVAEFDHHPMTADFKLGGVHDTKAWHYYWQRLGAEEFAGWRHPSIANFIEEERQFEKPVKVLSLGSGFCGPDLELARAFRIPYEITCVDINPKLFAGARERAEQENLNLRFEQADLNYITLPPDTYHLVFAHAILHHVINIERLFDQITRTLKPDGVCHFVEVGGENRVLMSKKSTRFANELLRLLPPDLAKNANIILTPEGGMEGIRQERLLPLIEQYFQPIFEIRHGAFMRFVCHATDVGLFNPQDPHQKSWLDFLIDADRSCVKRGLLAPLEIWGVYAPRAKDPDV